MVAKNRLACTQCKEEEKQTVCVRQSTQFGLAPLLSFLLSDDANYLPLLLLLLLLLVSLVLACCNCQQATKCAQKERKQADKQRPFGGWRVNDRLGPTKDSGD